MAKGRSSSANKVDTDKTKKTKNSITKDNAPDKATSTKKGNKKNPIKRTSTMARTAKEGKAHLKQNKYRAGRKRSATKSPARSEAKKGSSPAKKGSTTKSPSKRSPGKSSDKSRSKSTKGGKKGGAKGSKSKSPTKTKRGAKKGDQQASDTETKAETQASGDEQSSPEQNKAGDGDDQGDKGQSGDDSGAKSKKGVKRTRTMNDTIESSKKTIAGLNGGRRSSKSKEAARDSGKDRSDSTTKRGRGKSTKGGKGKKDSSKSRSKSSKKVKRLGTMADAVKQSKPFLKGVKAGTRSGLRRK